MSKRKSSKTTSPVASGFLDEARTYIIGLMESMLTQSESLNDIDEEELAKMDPDRIQTIEVLKNLFEDVYGACWKQLSVIEHYRRPNQVNVGMDNNSICIKSEEVC